MDEIRRDVIEAFDKTQAELGDLRGVRARMLRGAYAGRSIRSDKALRLAAGIATILIAALVIGTLVYFRAGSQPTPARGLEVPATTPLILYHDPTKVGQIDGITWDGRSPARVGDGGIDGGTSNPAGTLYSTGTDIRDRMGKVVGPLANSPPRTSRVAWADDELHYCQVVPAAYKGVGPGPALLQLVVPGGKALNVAQIGTYSSQNLPIPTVAACSVEGDRAVVSEAMVSPGFGVRDWVVQLSTGRILWTHTIKLTGSPAGVGIVATHDGRFVAESTLSSSSASVSATIYGPDGSAMAHVAGWIGAFSWDGSLAVTSPGVGYPVTLVRWRDGVVVWTGPPGLHFREARSEPGGTRIAIGMAGVDLADNLTGVLAIDLYVVSADGRLLWTKTNVNLA